MVTGVHEMAQNAQSKKMKKAREILHRNMKKFLALEIGKKMKKALVLTSGSK